MATLGRVRSKRLVLDIGSSAIRVCELRRTKGGYQLTKYYQREVIIEPGLDEDAKKEVLRDALKGLLKEAKIRTRKALFAVPGRSVFTRPRTLPPVPQYKVAQIVQYEIQQQIPFSLDQIALDYHILSQTEDGGYDVLMAAIKADVVDKHIEVFEGTKCTVSLVDVSPLAAYNWVKHLGEFGDQGECVALLDLGASTTDIIIERQNQFRFTRPLNLGGNDITAALRDKFNASFAEAEQFKRRRAFAPTGDPKRDGKVGEAIGPVLARMVSEINRSFAYFRSQPGGGVVDRVLIMGGGACLRNIVPYLQQRLGVDVRIVQPLSGLAISPAAQSASEHPEQASVALGLALRTCEAVPIEINLIPPRVLEAARRKEQVFYWILSILTLALIAASIIPARAQKDRKILEQINMCEQYLMPYDPALVESPLGESKYERQLDAVEKDIENRLDNLKELDRAYRRRYFALGILRTINDLRPEGNTVWISSFETTAITPADPKRPQEGIKSTGFPGLKPQTREGGALAPPRFNGIRILGYAKDPDSLLEFISRLGESSVFEKGVHFEQNNVQRVPFSELNQARVASSGGGMGTGAGRTPGSAAAAAPAGAEPMILSFRADLQFSR